MEIIIIIINNTLNTYIYNSVYIVNMSDETEQTIPIKKYMYVLYSISLYFSLVLLLVVSLEESKKKY